MYKCIYLLLVVAQLTFTASSVTKVRNCKLGVTEFKRLVTSKCFVDKSSLIQKFLAIRKRVVLVTAPSGYGKTVNMDMIKTFFDNQDRDPILDETTPNCRFLKKHNLTIYKSYKGDPFEHHCGQYPVISLKFTPIRGNSFKDVLNGLKYAVRDTFLQHKYLLKSYKLDEDEKEHLLIFTEEKELATMSRLQMTGCLVFLSETLYNYFRQKVIILIDDYDNLFWPILNGSFPREEAVKSVGYIDRFFKKLLHSNKFYEKALINARVRLSDGLKAKNTVHLPFMGDHPFAKFYGFTMKEIRRTMRSLNIMYIDGKFRTADIHYFYGGYNATQYNRTSKKSANCTSVVVTPMYRTSSIVKLFETEIIDGYWEDNEVSVYIEQFFLKGPVRQYILPALESNIITIDNSAQLTDTDIISLKIIVDNTVLFDRGQAAMFTHVLVALGYFIAVTNYTVKPPKYANFSDPLFYVYERIDLKIPNEEVRQNLFNLSHDTYDRHVMRSDPIKNEAFLNALNAFQNATAPLGDSIKQLFVNNVPPTESGFQYHIYRIIKHSELFSRTRIGFVAPLCHFKRNNKTYCTLKYLYGKSLGRFRADIMTIRRADDRPILIQTSPVSAQSALDEIFNKKVQYDKLFQSRFFNVSRAIVHLVGLHLNTNSGDVEICSANGRIYW